jgi:tetratricopeptide (TPR) repeat protein
MQAKYLALGAALLVLIGPAIAASADGQVQQQKAPEQGTQPSPGTAGQQAPGAAPSLVTPPAAPPINQEEEDAYKAFYDAHAGDPAKRVQLGEDFLKKFSDSHYVPTVYTQLTSAYMDVGQEDKMFVAGDKALELDPNNLAVLSILAMALPRRVKTNAPDAAQQFQQAETYARRVIELVAVVEKPDSVDDATFQTAKSEYLSMAHSGLGLIDYQRKQYADAVSDLSLAVQLSANPDPVDYYVLGAANMATSHFNEAAQAYEKCAAAGPMVTQCKTHEEDARKRATAQPGAAN